MSNHGASHPIHKATIWAAGAFIIAGWGGVMGNGSLALSIGSFLFGLLLALAYYLKLKDHSTKIIMLCVAMGLILIVVVSKPIADAWKSPVIAKTLMLSDINAGDWNNVAVGEKTNLTGKSFLRLIRSPHLNSQFVKGKSYRLTLEISHNGWPDSVAGGYLTLRYLDTATATFTDNMEKRESKKKNHVEDRISIGHIYREYPFHLGTINFVFLRKDHYRFKYSLEYLIDNFNGSPYRQEGIFVIDIQ